MKSASAGLIALLASGKFWRADIYTFTLVNGAVSRWTSGDRDLKVGANTYSKDGPKFDRPTLGSKIGMEVPELVITLSATSAHTIGGVPILQGCNSGALDGARVQIEYAVMPTYGDTSVGTVMQFSGRVSSPIAGRTQAQITARGDTELLNVQSPRKLFQAGCTHTLFDTGCGLVKSLFKRSSAVTAGSTKAKLNCGLTSAAGYFDLGTVTFTSGPNNGVSRSVKSYAPGQVIFSVPLVNAPTVGDTFDAYPGCDRLLGTCGLPKAIAFTRSGSTLNATAHGLANDTAVVVHATATLPPPLAESTTYFVVNTAANSFQLAAAPGGSAITLTGAGSGTFSVVQAGKFANRANFAGFPFVPVPETAA